MLQRIPDASLHLVGDEGAAPLRFLVGLSNLPQVQALRRFYDYSGSPGGKDSYLTALEKLARPELGKRIIFEGCTDHDKIHAHYRNAALLVNASLSESFGISVIEAMMLKIPVVATRTGGMQHTVIPGETGLLVDPAEPSALADAIIAVLTDSALARRMGEAGRTLRLATSHGIARPTGCCKHTEPQIGDRGPVFTDFSRPSSTLLS